MKIWSITIVCDCGALITAEQYDYHGDILDANMCPVCKKVISSNVVVKKDGLAVFLTRVPKIVARPVYWKEVTT